jgi:hypothetical protein
MANTLGNYNPAFFANEALIQLFKALGMAARVHRGAEEERNSTGRELGDVINLRRPSHFAAQTHVAGTGTTAQDVVGQNVQISLDQHQEVKFKVTDRELAYTSERIISEHIRPAAYALADKIDQDLHGLGTTVGPKAFVSGGADAGYITGPRQRLRNNNVPMGQDIHYLIDSGMEAAFLNLGIFHEAQITGQGSNQEALMNGSLGRRFGVEVFASQNADVAGPVMASTATASAATGDVILAADGAVLANVNSMLLKDGSLVETFQIGDTFTIAGDPTTYILTANTTLVAGGGTVTFYPALRINVADSVVVTFNLLNALEEAANLRNLMFHRNAFGLAFAPLPDTGDGAGALIDTVTDTETGLSVRARMFYDGDTATNSIALDALYGMQVLDGQLATQVIRASTDNPA